MESGPYRRPAFTIRRRERCVLVNPFPRQQPGPPAEGGDCETGGPYRSGAVILRGAASS
jgi:hypothetical protein